jgi:hypothetical protein
MADFPSSIRGLLNGKWVRPLGLWRTVDALYVWSAVIGLLLAFVLIAVAQVMQTGRLH